MAPQGIVTLCQSEGKKNVDLETLQRRHKRFQFSEGKAGNEHLQDRGAFYYNCLAFSMTEPLLAQTVNIYTSLEA